MKTLLLILFLVTVALHYMPGSHTTTPLGELAAQSSARNSQLQAASCLMQAPNTGSKCIACKGTGWNGNVKCVPCGGDGVFGN